MFPPFLTRAFGKSSSQRLSILLIGDMNMKTNEDFVLDIFKHTESGQRRQFQFLRNWQEYSNTKQIRRTHVLLVSSIRASSKKLFKKYCTAVKTGKTDPVKLLAYCTITKVLQFYEEELKTITDMVYEYEAYLMEGNLVDAWLFNSQRPVDKLWDHRI